MQLTRRISAGRLLLAAVACLGAPRVAAAGVSDQSLSYSFNYFADVDDVHVFSNYTNYVLDLESGVKIDTQWTHQTVVVPAVKAPAGSQEAVDAITTASRPIANAGDAYSDFSKGRDELQGDVILRRVKAGYYVSKEQDYFAQQLRGDVNHDFLGRSLNVSMGTSFGWDNIDPVSDADTQTAADSKTNWHLNLIGSQVLTPTTVLQLGTELNLVHGLQHNPYRNVYAAGTNVPERHPGERRRHDVFLKVNQYITNRSSVNLSYVYYTDDWGVTANTLGAKLNQYITPNVVMRYRYRFYSQGAADFYRDEYEMPDGIGGYRTGDYRLSDFSAHLFGTRLEWELGGLGGRLDFLRGIRLSLNYERYFNSNNFSANILESGLSLAF